MGALGPWWDRARVLALAGCLAAAGCAAAPCAEGTLYVTLALAEPAQAADTLDIALAVDGQPVQHRRAARSPGEASDLVQIGFAGDYPAGRPLVLTIEALAGDAALASATATFPAQPGCTALGLALGPAAASDAGDDGSATADAGDGAAPGEDLATGDFSVAGDFSAGNDLAVGSDLAVVSDLAIGQVQLLALSPPIANTGATLTLEGTFGSTVTVHFPGGVAQAATVLGSHRATVTVPAGATTGDLTVTSNGMTTTALPFRRAPFALGLQGFQVENEQASGPQISPTLAQPRIGAVATVHGGYLYVVGGETADQSGFQSSVERALVNADGTLGLFTTLTASLAKPRANACSVTLGSSLYVLGGYVGNQSWTASVERATFNADGTLSTFTEPRQLVSARTGAVCFVAGNYLYVAGGYPATGTVERAAINADESLGAFQTVSGVQPAVDRERAASVVVGNQVYVLGGKSVASVERATIAGDGSLSTFTLVSGVSLSAARELPVPLVLGSTLYLVGGANGGVGVTSVDKATFDGSGNLSTFAAVSGLTAALPPLYAAGAVVGDFLYLVGSSGTDGRVQHASLNASGALGTFANNGGVSLKTARGLASTAVSGNHLYLIGGYNGNTLGSVEHATIAPDGTISGFQTLSSALVTQRDAHGSLLAGNRLYVFGGYDGSKWLSSVESAIINPDGTLGSFATVSGVSLRTGRCCFSSVVAGGYLYVLGGNSSSQSGILASVERAAIGSDGSLGNFATVSSTLDVARNLASSVILGGSVYLMGGHSPDALASIERATIAADGSLGGFAQLTGKLSKARGTTTLAVVGPWLYLVGGSDNSIDGAPIGLGRSLGSFALTGGSLPMFRSFASGLIAGNLLSIFGGQNTDETASYSTVYQGALQ